MKVNILITGGAGFIGRLLIQRLSRHRMLVIDGVEREIGRIFAVDLATAGLEPEMQADARLECADGAFGDSAILSRIAELKPELIIHLAAVVSSAAEADFALGMNVNFHATAALVDLCFGFAVPPVFIFSSSVAVFSCQDNDTIDDRTQPLPRSSYGTQKLMGELLLRDASRKKRLRARALRFPTVSVRPGKPNAAASSFASGIIREPLANQIALLPVGRDIRLHLASPDISIENVMRAIALEQVGLAGETTITLPGISVTVDQIIDTLKELAGESIENLIQDSPNEAIECIIRSWPGEIRAPRAMALGFEVDQDTRMLIGAYINRHESV